VEEDCKANRLVCSKCLVFVHSDHPQSCIFLEDFKDPKKMSTRAWSKDQIGKDVEKFLKENVSLQDEVDKIMDGFIDDIIKETKVVKNEMRKKRVEGKTEVQKNAKVILEKYERAYDVNHIRMLITQFMEEKISDEEMNKKLEEVIASREEIEKL
jgi:hypothetical protein